MSSQTSMANSTHIAQTSQIDQGNVVRRAFERSRVDCREMQASNLLPKGFKARPTQAQNATPSQTICPHIAPGSLANFELWFEGEDPRWCPMERTILIMRDAIEREAGETASAEIEQSAEDEEMDLEDLEASQAALAAHIASVFAAYGEDTNQASTQDPKENEREKPIPKEKSILILEEKVSLGGVPSKTARATGGTKMKIK
ncbi:hypothetical protein CPB86DRAFT_795428 [Serendipita vermifera]|nr:hypothetical protein CPB86DRAFT_795428 [Serendipita vermifera]